MSDHSRQKNLTVMMLVAMMMAAPSLSAQPPERDPTRPLDYRAAARTVDLTLNALMRGGERELAVINGQRLREKELIANSGGVRLLRIEADAVVVGLDGRQWRLTLNNETVRRPGSAQQ